MKSFAIFLLFVGTVLVLQGYYSQQNECQKPKTVLKYVPRTFYEEQHSGDNNIDEYYKGIFENENIKT
jgi:hypothetical protein